MSERPSVPAGVDNPQDGSPSWSEVEQHEELPELPIPAVPVHVDGPVQTQELPPRTSVARSMLVTTEPTELVANDLRRASFLVIPIDGAVWIGKTTNEVRPTSPGGRAPGAKLPQSVQGYRLNGSSRLFVASVAAGPVEVTVVAESWAD